MRIRWRYILIAMAMLLGLYLYFMYRSQDTIVNALLAKLGAREFPFLMNIWHKHYAIPQWCMYSLPEGLWVFSATLLSIRLEFPIREKRIHLKYLPFLFAMLVELVQVLGITNGQFDWLDIFVSFIFTVLALIIPSKEQKKNAIESKEFWLLVLIYAMVYLSDVWV
jgi:Ca2+/Na+ antiporter